MVYLHLDIINEVRKQQTSLRQVVTLHLCYQTNLRRKSLLNIAVVPNNTICYGICLDFLS